MICKIIWDLIPKRTAELALSTESDSHIQSAAHKLPLGLLLELFLECRSKVVHVNVIWTTDLLGLACFRIFSLRRRVAFLMGFTFFISYPSSYFKISTIYGFPNSLQSNAREGKKWLSTCCINVKFKKNSIWNGHVESAIVLISLFFC